MLRVALCYSYSNETMQDNKAVKIRISRDTGCGSLTFTVPPTKGSRSLRGYLTVVEVSKQ